MTTHGILEGHFLFHPSSVQLIDVLGTLEEFSSAMHRKNWQ